jgi:hypothetical protein
MATTSEDPGTPDGPLLATIARLISNFPQGLSASQLQDIWSKPGLLKQKLHDALVPPKPREPLPAACVLKTPQNREGRKVMADTAERYLTNILKVSLEDEEAELLKIDSYDITVVTPYMLGIEHHARFDTFFSRALETKLLIPFPLMALPLIEARVGELALGKQDTLYVGMLPLNGWLPILEPKGNGRELRVWAAAPHVEVGVHDKFAFRAVRTS